LTVCRADYTDWVWQISWQAVLSLELTDEIYVLHSVVSSEVNMLQQF